MGPVHEGRCLSMGQTIVAQVISKLTNNGITTMRAFPAEKLPTLTGIRAAVSLKNADQDAGTAVVSVHVCAPAAMGGAACEDAALRVSALLYDMGGLCVQHPCSQLGKTEILCAEVCAEFYGCDTGYGWTNFSVVVAGTSLYRVRAFKAWRSIGDAENLGQTLWKFRIEEDLYPQASEGAQVTEPFTIKVIRGSKSETYGECTLTYHRCELYSGRLRRIRQGIAKTRTVSG